MQPKKMSQIDTDERRTSRTKQIDSLELCLAAAEAGDLCDEWIVEQTSKTRSSVQ